MVSKSSRTSSLVASAMNKIKGSFGSMSSNGKKVEEENQTKKINIMILLMEDDGKRHELMPLQLPIEKQVIGYLMKEVQEKATIRSLRNQGYHCVCNGDATVLKSEGLIENYFNSEISEELYHLVIMVPYGKTAKEIVKLAQPILADESISKKIAKITDRQICISSNNDNSSQVSEISDDSYPGDRAKRNFDDNSSSSSSI